MAAKPNKGGAVVTAKPITVTVNGETYELVANMAAVRMITGALGGLNPAFQALQNLNLDAAAQIISAGCGGKMKHSQVAELGEALWAADDRNEALGAVMEYMVLLLRGGKAVDDEPAAEASEGNS